jgi:hypothetical protein
MGPEMKAERIYRAHVRLHALVGALVAVFLVVTHAGTGGFIAAIAGLGLLWAVLTFIRLRAEDHALAHTEHGDGPSRRGRKEHASA